VIPIRNDVTSDAERARHPHPILHKADLSALCKAM
jgi:hypothetical protein